MLWNLGIIIDDVSGIIINHRSLIKVLFNPFLRLIGWQIATKYDLKTNTLGRAILTRCPKKPLKFSFDYDIYSSKSCLKQRLFI